MTFCSNCGHAVETDDNFCENCGYPLSKPSSPEITDEELPLGIIAGFRIFPKKNKIIEFPDKYSMVIYPDSLIFAKYHNEWNDDALKLGLGKGFWTRVNNRMKLEEVYANTYRSWPAYKVLNQDPDNFSYAFKKLERIVIDAHEGSMTTGVDIPGGTSIRVGQGGAKNIIDYEFYFVTAEETRLLKTFIYPREINMLRQALGDKLEERVKIIAGLPDDPFKALLEALRRKNENIL